MLSSSHGLTPAVAATAPEAVVRVEEVGFAYSGAPVLHKVSLALRRGEMAALLGRNGAGKSTLIRLISGVLAPARGAVYLNGAPLSRLKRGEVARQLAVVPQELHVPFAFTTREVVTLGRTAHVPFLHGETARDRDAIEHALRLLDLTELAVRPYNSLSGGERQRAVLAMAVAQEAGVLLLDEPTVHLDLAHQVRVLRLVRELNRSQGVTVLAAVHDLNLAALLFDRLLLLKDGHIVADGPPTAVVTADLIYDVFGTTVGIYPHPTAGVPQITLLP